MAGHSLERCVCEGLLDVVLRHAGQHVGEAAERAEFGRVEVGSVALGETEHEDCVLVPPAEHHGAVAA